MPVFAAKSLAVGKHAGLYRPTKNKEPMITHIEEVAKLVEIHGGSKEMIAAAWLHDVIEDTDTSLNDIQKIFGLKIANMVSGLTDPPEFSGKPIEERKKLQALRIEGMDKEIKIIKLCNQISNIRAILNDPPLDWTQDECALYIKGAGMVAAACKNCNPALDKMFSDLYVKAKDTYKNL